MEKYSGLLGVQQKTIGAKALGIFSRTVGLASILILAIIPGGCLVGNDEFNEALISRDEYRGELTLLHESNDSLKREISQTYESCDLITTQLSVLAAMNIHNKFTADLARPRPVLPPPIDQRPATTTRQTPRQQTPPRQQPQQPQQQPDQKPQQQPRGPSSGPSGGGAIDWGF